MIEGLAVSGVLFAALWMLFKFNRSADLIERNYHSLNKEDAYRD